MENKNLESVHSGAFNFGDFVTGGVDPRTGIYTCSLSLNQLCSESLNGPLFKLALGFNPLNGTHSGFGMGWSLALTRYDVGSKTLTLSSGERYRASEKSAGLEFRDMKLETVKVSKPGVGRYDVQYKNGTREELQMYADTGIAVPVKIVSANGASITLRYEQINGHPVLSGVSDTQRQLLKITRKDSRVTLTQYPDTTSQAAFVLSLKEGRVTTIALPVGGGWELDYELIDDVGYLNRVVSPLGAREIIRYTKDGHRALAGGPVQSLPYVSAHSVYPRQNQPAIHKTYSFSDWNFLGHGAGVDWSDERDPLELAPWSYQYSSDELLKTGDVVHSHTKRVYNKFHLLISQVTTCADAVTSLSTEYHCLVGKAFAEQPAQFRMPKVQTARYENRRTQKTREEVTHTEYDAVGNLLEQIGPDGITTRSEFYPAAGAQGCPADPLNFVRFERQRTVTPASTEGMTSDKSVASSVVVRYRYAELPALNGARLPMVLPVEESLFELVGGAEILRSKSELAYFNVPDDALRHGLLQKQTVAQNGMPTVSEFSYTQDGNELKLQTIIRGHDGTSKTSSQTLSTFNGLKLAEQQEDGGAVAFEYDDIGRLLSKTIGTTNAATSRTVYQAATDQKVAAMLTTDLVGTQQKTVYDGLGRIIAVEQQDCDHVDEARRTEMRAIYNARHDQLGRLVEQTRFDWRDGIARPVKSQFFYDDWGQVKTTAHADGRKEHRDFDPVSRTETTWLEGMGKSVTRLNDFAKPDSVEAFSLSGESLGRIDHEYDGLGRAVSQVDAVGNKTTYEYDVFGRLRRSVLPDGYAVVTEYAAHSRETLPTEVKIGAQSLGRQTFDGLGRLTESLVGGRTVSAGYEAGCGQPHWQKSASGEKVEFAYNRDFGGRLMRRQAPGLLATFTYHPVHGQPLSGVEQEHEVRFDYFPSGRLKSETTVHGTQQHTASCTYSFGGLPLTYVDVLGNEHKTNYDDWGRPSSFEQGAIKTAFSYNALGQLEQINSQGEQGKQSMMTRLTYDDLGRERSRSFEIGGGMTQILKCSYTLAGKLAHKVLSIDGEVVRSENYAYDQRGRLKGYSCDGTLRPRDPYGKEIIQQTYQFDALDNIVSLKTEFPGASNTTTFIYSDVDPAQLIAVRHSHADYPPPVTLTYDANGQMIKDDQARELIYDSLGRLTRVATETGTICRYQYDAQDRLVGLSQPDGALVRRFYRDGRVVNEVSDADRRTCWRQTGMLLGEQQSAAGIKLFGTDQQQSVLTLASDQPRSDIAYSPYGYRAVEGAFSSLAGFNGEPLDPSTGLYHLGNGYRAYSPTLMRFLGPDSLSPFGAGGLNPYAYCLGDPINRVDPTGHVSWQSVVGISLSVFSVAASLLTFGAATPLAVASLTLALASGFVSITGSIADEIAPESGVGELLGYVSLGLGLASFASALGAAAHGAGKVAGAFKSGLSANPREAAANMSRGMGGRATRAASSSTRSGSSTGPAESTSTRWTYKTHGGRRNIDGFAALTDQERAKFFRFKDAVKDNGMQPGDAAQLLGSQTRYNEMVPFKSATPHQLRDPDFFNQTGYTEIRLSGGTRLFFYADHDKRTLTMHAFGHTVRGG
jgi:RHS repeat-associated protein